MTNPHSSGGPVPGPPATVLRTPLLAADLVPRSIARVDVVRIAMPPGLRSGLHLHPCPVVGVVLEGSVRFQIEGEPERMLHAGDAFHEPASARVAHFDAGDDGAVFVAHYLLAPDEHDTLVMLE